MRPLYVLHHVELSVCGVSVHPEPQKSREVQNSQDGLWVSVMCRQSHGCAQTQESCNNQRERMFLKLALRLHHTELLLTAMLCLKTHQYLPCYAETFP